jgi:hypothetical protein
MATMQGDPRQTIMWAQAITGIQSVGAQPGGQGMYPSIRALRADMPTVMMPASAGVPALQAYPGAGPSTAVGGTPTGGGPGTSEGATIYPTMSSEPLPGLAATTSSGAAPPGASADGPGLSTRLMQRVQQHQVSPVSVLGYARLLSQAASSCVSWSFEQSACIVHSPATSRCAAVGGASRQQVAPPSTGGSNMFA